MTLAAEVVSLAVELFLDFIRQLLASDAVPVKILGSMENGLALLAGT